MIGIGDETHLYLLEFAIRRGLEREIVLLRKKTRRIIVSAITPPLIQIERELANYFSDPHNKFHTSIRLLGTRFQQAIWDILCNIPVGETISYKKLAERLGPPTAIRAVARANGANHRMVR